MTWRDSAQRIDAAIATMLASATDGSTTSTEALRATRQLEAAMAEMVALVDIERTPTAELREIMQRREAFSKKLADFEVRAEAILAPVEHQGRQRCSGGMIGSVRRSP